MLATVGARPPASVAARVVLAFPPPALSQACCCVRCELTCAAYACALRPTSNRRAVRVQAKTGEDHKGKWRALDVDESDDQQVRCWLASFCSETANLPML